MSSMKKKRNKINKLNTELQDGDNHH